MDFVQLREAGLPASTLATLTRQALAIVSGTHTRVVVNDRLDVALAAGAHGVHLRRDSIPASVVRTMAPPGFVVGLSVHSTEAAMAAGPDVDYLLAGTVWPSASKAADHVLLGLSGLASIVRAVHVPVLAIGGVTGERLAEIARAGAAGAAAIGLFVGAAGPTGCRAGQLGDVVGQARQMFDTGMQGS